MNRFYNILMKYKKLKEDMNKTNDVSSMSYYDGDLKPIDAMMQQFGNQHVISWCILNAFKYLWRCMKKHETPIEDLKKAQYYINKAIELWD